MKNLKILSVLFLSLLVVSCSSEDDASNVDPNAEFNATIEGGTFSNYIATLGSYSATNDVGLTIAVTDDNTNIIRLFMNSTGGFTSGVIKEVGNEDGDGFITTVIIRDQAALITYNSISGSINITQNIESAIDPSFRLISGDFNITASSTTSGTDVTMIGTFNNIFTPDF